MPSTSCARPPGARARDAVAGELGVGLVDHHDPRRRGVDRLDHLQRQRGAGGVVRRGQEHHLGPVLLDLLHDPGRVEGEVVLAEPAHPAGPGGHRDQSVHRVGGLEAQRGAPGAAEGHQDLLDDLVRPVGRPDLTAGQVVAQVPGQLGPQRVGVAVRVPVQGQRQVLDGARQVGGQRDRGPVRVLVRVQPDRDVELGRPVGAAPPQVVPQRQGGLHRLRTPEPIHGVTAGRAPR
jgi:hypothetical protein